VRENMKIDLLKDTPPWVESEDEEIVEAATEALLFATDEDDEDDEDEDEDEDDSDDEDDEDDEDDDEL
jgi:hypothetical protein